MRIFLLSFAVTIALVGCTRTPGEGGITTVTGNVELEQRIVITNPANAVVVPAADEDVFITYGERVGPDDQVQTNFDGAFAFYELRPGRTRCTSTARIRCRRSTTLRISPSFGSLKLRRAKKLWT